MGSLVIIPVVFIIIGVVQIVWPGMTRRFEQGWFGRIKDHDEYVGASRLFGVVFLILGLGFLALFLAGAMK